MASSKYSVESVQIIDEMFDHHDLSAIVEIQVNNWPVNTAYLEYYGIFTTGLTKFKLAGPHYLVYKRTTWNTSQGHTLKADFELIELMDSALNDELKSKLGAHLYPFRSIEGFVQAPLPTASIPSSSKFRRILYLIFGRSPK